MSSSSFSPEEWVRTWGPIAQPQPCPNLSQPQEATPAWPGSWDLLLKGATTAYKGPTSRFAAWLSCASRWVEICPGATKAQAGNPLPNALAPAPTTGVWRDLLQSTTTHRGFTVDHVIQKESWAKLMCRFSLCMANTFNHKICWLILRTEKASRLKGESEI